MADNVVVYWVAKAGTIYAADVVSRTYVGISSMERLGAAKRALDFAGIPHADWPRGEPLTMEEFGVEVRNASATDAVLNAINGHAANAEAHGAETRRMLGVLLGWNNPADGSPEVQGFPRLVQNPPWQILKQTTTGWWYAYGPGVFFHIRNMDHYTFLRVANLVSDEKWALLGDDNMSQFIHDEMMLSGSLRIEDVAKPPPPATYTVKAGDTLGAIAKATGKSVADLVAWNKLANPDAINEGQVLQLGPPQ